MPSNRTKERQLADKQIYMLLEAMLGELQESSQLGKLPDEKVENWKEIFRKQLGLD